jgi:hypothetical protein
MPGEGRSTVIAYIRDLAGLLVKQLEEGETADTTDLSSRVQVWREELDRLDPRYFLPASRLDFVEIRRQIRCISGTTQDEWDWMIKQPLEYRGTIERFLGLFRRAVEVLGNYAGEGTGITIRSFAFVSNHDLREIVERDYKELSLVLMPDAAWKSAVVIAGSILEAILYDQLTKNPAEVARSMGHPKAPRKKGGAVKDISNDTSEDEWRLTDLIEVAAGLAIIPPHRANSIDQVLRDYRNFVHPRKEIKRQHPCREAEAYQAKGALDGVCDYLDPNIT